MYCVDAWSMYRGFTTDLLHPDPQLNQQEFYYALIEELIDNNIWLSTNRRRSQARTDCPNNTPIAHDTINPTPEIQETNNKKRGRYGTMENYCKQGRCRTF